MPNGDGFSFGAPDGARPIFNRSRIREVQNVVIVEGENKVKALHALGIVATCSSGGANAGTKADWSPVAGKCVTFWRDFDEPGEKLQSDVIAELEKLTPPPDIYIIDVTALGLGDGEDCIDYIANLTGSPQEIASIVQNVIASAHSTGGYGALEKHIEEILSGRWFNVPFVWSLTTRYTRALVPGSVCVFCGGAGSTKSFSVIQNLRFWKNRGILACALMLEDGETFHMQRLLAQIAGNGNLTDDEWMRSHQEQTRSLRDLAKPELKEMEKYINAISDPMAMTVESLLGWIEAKCRDGFRIVCIDPITAMVKGQYGFNDDFRFLMGAKKIIEKYKASLLLVTHPRKMAANAKDAPFTMSDLSGGVCYERFAHCIISLRKLDVPKDANIRSEMGVLQNFSSNRELSIMKSRNARGNATISLNFEDATLELRELGISENDE